MLANGKHCLNPKPFFLNYVILSKDNMIIIIYNIYMNVNITGIYDNTVIVDSNLYDGIRLLQTDLSSIRDTLLGMVEGLPN